MWESSVLPNTMHPTEEMTFTLNQVRNGIDWTEYANKTAFEGKNALKHYEKNMPCKGAMPDGVTSKTDFIPRTIPTYLKRGALEEVTHPKYSSWILPVQKAG